MEILIILFLILLNGFFSLSEIALVSARKSRLEMQAKKGSIKARAALNLANHPNKFLSTVQIGITLIGLLTGIYSGDTITDKMKTVLLSAGLAEEYAAPLSVALILICITYFSLVLGELLPKRIGLTNPEGIAKAVARPMRIVSLITAPFVWTLTFSTDLLMKVFNIKPSADSKVTEEEIKAIVQEGAEGGEIQEIEQDIVERVFTMGDRRVSSVMTHRQDVVFLSLDFDAQKVREQVIDQTHAAYPVYENDKDRIAGMVYLKDLFATIDNDDFSLRKITRAPQYIHENTSAYKALEVFKETGIHHSIVTDEYGRVEGFITLNDILEALVGNVSDFYKEEFSIHEREDGTFIVDGIYPFHDFLNYFDLDDLSSEYEFNTVSGLLLELFRNIPKEGDKTTWHGFEFEVLDMDGARIDKIMVKINRVL
ncbi:MAG TPA: hemolysin family protein [Bacteroidia bacterium]|nr:hemolysin family protein [Bacteroidia bacterium]